jgi:hypothetical protein
MTLIRQKAAMATRGNIRFSMAAGNNVYNTAIAEAKANGYDSNVTPVFVDIDCSEIFRSWKAMTSMTLAKTRSKSGG